MGETRRSTHGEVPFSSAGCNRSGWEEEEKTGFAEALIQPHRWATRNRLTGMKIACSLFLIAGEGILPQYGTGKWKSLTGAEFLHYLIKNTLLCVQHDKGR
jgi:hypothetical protein